MGFPENKKLAKDINTVNTECANRLGALMTQMSGRMDTANRILEGIAAKEDRYVYRPSTSSGDIVLAAQSASYKRNSDNNDSAKDFVLPNTFDALYDGEVTIYTSCSWSQVGGSFACGTYIVKQIYPIEAEIIAGSLNPGADSTSGSKSTSANFSVVKGAIYQITLKLTSAEHKGSYGSASATADIRSIVQFVEGSSTKYYYPAEGAPKIVDVDGQYSSPGGLPDFFTPKFDGAVWVSFDVAGSIGNATFKIIGGGGEQELRAIGGRVSAKVVVMGGKPYSLSINTSGYGTSVTISNVSVSAITTTSTPVIVPFEVLEEPVPATQVIPSINPTQAYSGYILAKLPQSTDVLGATYLIATCGTVYPGDDAGSQIHGVLYDMQNRKADYTFGYGPGYKYFDKDIPSLGQWGGNTSFLIVDINNETCLFGMGNTLAGLQSVQPVVYATLF